MVWPFIEVRSPKSGEVVILNSQLDQLPELNKRWLPVIADPVTSASSKLKGRARPGTTEGRLGACCSWPTPANISMYRLQAEVASSNKPCSSKTK